MYKKIENFNNYGIIFQTKIIDCSKTLFMIEYPQILGMNHIMLHGKKSKLYKGVIHKLKH